MSDQELLVYFYEDAVEQLGYMESALLDASDGTNDPEKIGEIFRAMHTIKGSAGMFGFDDIVQITHKAENLLDEVRKGNVVLDANLATLFMKIKDLVSTLVEINVNADDIPDDMNTTLQSIESEILKYSESATQDETSIQKEAIEQLSQENEILNENQNENQWFISLRILPEFFSSGMSIESTLRFLKKDGDILLSILIDQNIPSLEKIDPVKSYLGIDIIYQSEHSKEEIEEVFEFVEDDIDLIIIKHNDIQALAHLLTQREDNLKQILLDNYCYEEKDFLSSPQQYIDTKADIIDEISFTDIKKAVTMEEEIFSVPSTPHIQIKNEEDSIQVDDNIPSNEFVINDIDIDDIIISKEIPKAPTKLQDSKTNIKTTIKKEADDKFYLRVNSKKIDTLMNKISQMVIKNAQIATNLSPYENEEIDDLVNDMENLLDEIRDDVMDVRMVQVKDSFIKYRRIVNDTANKLGKKINFVLEGEDTELDKTLVEKLSDPLTHMIRNSVDHGIETTQKRIENKKPEQGTVVLRAYPDSGMIVIEVEDDGAGIDKNIIFQKAVEKNIIPADAHLNDNEIFNLIFAAGFSTASEVTDISGRGVGMDVVKRNIEELRGHILIESVVGKGSKFTIRLPLTLAIIDGFLIQSGHSKFVIPVDMILQCLEYTKEYVGNIKDASTIQFNNEVIPLLNLREFYNDKLTTDEYKNNTYNQNIIIVKFSKHKIALLVNELYGQFQTVIKPLGNIFSKVPGVSGGTILGSSEIALILDIPKLVEYKIKNSNY